jgi:hypothetical protein
VRTCQFGLSEETLRKCFELLDQDYKEASHHLDMAAVEDYDMNTAF